MRMMMMRTTASLAGDILSFAIKKKRRRKRKHAVALTNECEICRHKNTRFNNKFMLLY